MKNIYTTKVAEFYDLVWTKYLPDYQATQEHLEMFFEDKEIQGKKVLDAGCGLGLFALIFAQKGAKEVIGLDVSQGSLERAQQLANQFHLKNVQFLEGDILDLKFPDQSFDIIWAWGSVHHTADPYRGLQELIRVLKKRRLSSFSRIQEN